MIGDVSDVQHQRAHQYAACTYALARDGVTDGSAAIFDQGLTNGLAAIVANEWPGDELARNGVLSARRLLTIIERRGASAEAGVVRVLRKDLPEWQPSFDGAGEDLPTFTTVQVSVLRQALDLTQAIRHARKPAEARLTSKHLRALEELARHPALSPWDISADRAEDALLDADEAERQRAAKYYDTLGDAERTRRDTSDYEDDLYPWADDESPAEECPVCLRRALIVSHRDGMTGQVAVGTCMVCSYARTDDVAEYLGMVEDLNRVMASDD